MLLVTDSAPPLGVAIFLYIVWSLVVLLGGILLVLLWTQSEASPLQHRSASLTAVTCLVYMGVTGTHLLASPLRGGCEMDLWVSGLVVPVWIIILGAHGVRGILLRRAQAIRRQTSMASIAPVAREIHTRSIAPHATRSHLSSLHSSGLHASAGLTAVSVSSSGSGKGNRDERVLALLQPVGEGPGDRFMKNWSWLYTPRIPGMVLLLALGHIVLTVVVERISVAQGGDWCGMSWIRLPGYGLSGLYLIITGGILVGLYTGNRIKGGAIGVRGEVGCACTMAVFAYGAMLIVEYAAPKGMVQRINTFPVGAILGLIWVISGAALLGPLWFQLLRSHIRGTSCKGKEVEEGGVRGGEKPMMAKTVVSATDGVERPADLAKVLERRPRLGRAFKEFTVRDQSIALLMYRERCAELLKAARSPDGMAAGEYEARCRDLVIMFFAEGAAWRLPIEEEMLEAVLEAHRNGSLGAHSFIPAERAILAALLAGPWPRFVAERRSRGILVGMEEGGVMEGLDRDEEEVDEERESMEGRGETWGIHVHDMARLR